MSQLNQSRTPVLFLLLLSLWERNLYFPPGWLKVSVFITWVPLYCSVVQREIRLFLRPRYQSSKTCSFNKPPCSLTEKKIWYPRGCKLRSFIMKIKALLLLLEISTKILIKIHVEIRPFFLDWNIHVWTKSMVAGLGEMRKERNDWDLTFLIRKHAIWITVYVQNI